MSNYLGAETAKYLADKQIEFAEKERDALEDRMSGVSKYAVGQKYDQGKLMYDLIPMKCMDELAKILTYGAEKYGKPSGWETVPDMENRYYAALMRHLSKNRQGEKLDPESGYSHLSHALCNVVFLLWKELQNGPKPEVE